MRLVLIILPFFISTLVASQTMQIGIFYNKNITTYTVSVQEGGYILECDGEKFGEYKKNNIFYVSILVDKIELRDKSNLIGSFKKIALNNIDKNSSFAIRGVNPSTQSIEFDDALIFELTDNKLNVINHIDLEKYIAGVIEAEGGYEAPLEYYKAQAILIRTYTIKNIYKHAEEGFNLCDNVHCQAYHGRSQRNPEIYNATSATAGLVLIDRDSILVMSPFHANCGGLTSKAGIYWQSDLPYLQGVWDPFCQGLSNSTWEKQISLNDWNTFLQSMGIKQPEKYTTYSASSRQKYYINNSPQVTFRQIREKFGLKSSFFSISKNENQIVFKGRGYGHGIGMCQIGAMQMARVGYTYIDIIHFYFQQVILTDYREMELHRY